MEFEDFLNKLENGYSPDKAYKLYLQTQILILQQILITRNLITREDLDDLENKIFSRIADKNNSRDAEK